ncbi:serine/threonine-protein kinase [Nocardioides zeae]|uniref:non-specific serine/threonine protein kinase n=1 Tax=Nocardioides zeae TaxID=1457234 RepID=A0A6P0HH52_9ACTN|nr:serine/threonine-protein kinase [Nocardioides zeae]NEN78012.1 serine/threonine protein kinase [Nocardioides zeae]
MDPNNPERFADDARRYRLDARVATGGMGEVWRATDTVLGRVVAVKILKAEYADDPTFRGRFETEARNAAALFHPNVAGIFDFGQSATSDGSGSTRPYLVMELVDGQPLSALLRPDQPMDPAIVVDIMAQAADGIGAAHRAGIVHRDVKPANLLVTPDRTVKITDFGIARAADGLALTQTGMVMGTPQYISPEQAQGMTAGPAADVYSLGVVAFECLAGRRPFVAETAVATALAHLRDPVPDLPGNVPPGLASVVRRAMAKKPEERFADGAELARALRDPSSVAAPAAAAEPAPTQATQVLGGAAVPAAAAAATAFPPTGAAAVVTEETTEPAGADEPRKTPVLPWVAGILALLLVAALVWIFVATSGGDDDDPAAPPSETSSAPPTSSATTETTTSEPTSETTSAEPETFDLDVDSYRGRNINEVRDELRDQFGLEVTRDEVENDGSQVPNTVSEISPSTGLTAGDSVTVQFWGPEPSPEPTETQPTETQPTETEPTLPVPTDTATTEAP